MINTTRRGSIRRARFWKWLVCCADSFLRTAGRLATRPLLCATVCLLPWGIRVRAQTPVKRTPIAVLSADSQGPMVLNGHTGHEYSKSVKIQHGDMAISCDWAFYDDSTNQLTASGNVQLVLDQSTVVKADTIRYGGDDQKALLRGRVIFQNHGLILNTSQLDYSRATGIVHYANKPRVVNGQYMLTILEGYYDREEQQFSTRPEVPPILLALNKAPVAPTPPDSVNISPPRDAETNPIVKPVNDSLQTTNAPVSNTLKSVPVSAVSHPDTDKAPPAFVPAVMVKTAPKPASQPVSAKSGSVRPVSTSTKAQAVSAPQTMSKVVPAPAKATGEVQESELERLLNPKKDW